MLLTITLLVCAAAIGALVWSYDLYDKEPWYMVLLAVIAGGVMMVGAGWLETQTLRLLIDHVPFALLLSLVSATYEEIGKLLVVILIAVLFHRVFNDPMDGIIYGALVGIGAALIESAVLIRHLDDAVEPRGEIIRLFGHCIFGGISGFAIGLYVIRHRWRHVLLITCLTIAMLLHFSNNYLVLANSDLAEPSAAYTATAITIMLTGLGLFFSLVLYAQRLSQEYFESEKNRYHRFGWPFNRLIRPPE